MCQFAKNDTNLCCYIKASLFTSPLPIYLAETNSPIEYGEHFVEPCLVILPNSRKIRPYDLRRANELHWRMNEAFIKNVTANANIYLTFDL